MSRTRGSAIVTDRLLVVQRLCIGVGVILLAVWAAAWLHASVNSQSDIEAFEAARAALVAQARAAEAPHGAGAEDAGVAVVARNTETVGVSATAAGLVPAAPTRFAETGEPDTALWSPGRVDDYRASLAADFDPPEGVLRIPAISLAVPVLQGTDDLTLNRAVGRIPGTARIGATRGNLGIAGHRDSFFRGLKDIGPGDTIQLDTLWNKLTYEVSDITITTPSDVAVLQRSEEGTLTLVTCYPFYFVGHAPQRYIVTATLVEKESI